MADIELVIKIPEEDYLVYSELSEKEKANELTYYEKIIANGTPLPKEYGRLIDADKLLETWYDDFCKFMTQAELNSMNNIIKNAPTIIEANKEDGA